MSAIQNEGTGLLIHGCRGWTDVCVESELTPMLLEDAGLAVRVQGLKRYYALRITRNRQLQIVKSLGKVTVLAEASLEWKLDSPLRFKLVVIGNQLFGSVGDTVIEAMDAEKPLANGAIGIVVTEGRIGFESVKISPTA